MKNNDKIYGAIKKSLTDDLIIAYEVFKEEEHKGLIGVKLVLNPSGEFAKYLRENPDKLADFTEHLYSNIEFNVHLIFSKEFEDGFFPLIEN